MKTINITFTEEEHKNLTEFKRNISWHDFILLMQVHCIEAQKRGDFEIYNGKQEKERSKGRA